MPQRTDQSNNWKYLTFDICSESSGNGLEQADGRRTTAVPPQPSKKQGHFTNDKTKCQADTKCKTEPIKCQETCGVAVSPSVWLVLTFNQRFARQLWATALNALRAKVAFVFFFLIVFTELKHRLPADNKHRVRSQYVWSMYFKISKGDFKAKSFRIVPVFRLIIYWLEKICRKQNSPVFAASYREMLNLTDLPKCVSALFCFSAKFTSWTEGSRRSEFRLQSADESDDHISVFLSVTEGGCGQIKHVLISVSTLLLSPHCCCIWEAQTAQRSSRVQLLAFVSKLVYFSTCIAGAAQHASCPTLRRNRK